MSGIGKHLATFNLFREADHSLHVTIAEARGVREELGQSGAPLHLCAMNALRVALLDPSQSERVSRLEGIAADSFDGIEERYALLLQEGHSRGRLAVARSSGKAGSDG